MNGHGPYPTSIRCRACGAFRGSKIHKAHVRLAAPLSGAWPSSSVPTGAAAEFPRETDEGGAQSAPNNEEARR